MQNDPIIEELHQIRQKMLDEFGGDIDALIDDCNRRVLSGEYGQFRVVTRAPAVALAVPRNVDPQNG